MATEQKQDKQPYSEWEKPLFDAWSEHGFFERTPGFGKNGAQSYTVVIPPPNVTGVLHMGHALNDTIQDACVRRARMQGYQTRWIVGVTMRASLPRRRSISIWPNRASTVTRSAAKRSSKPARSGAMNTAASSSIRSRRWAARVITNTSSSPCLLRSHARCARCSAIGTTMILSSVASAS